MNCTSYWMDAPGRRIRGMWKDPVIHRDRAGMNSKLQRTIIPAGIVLTTAQDRMAWVDRLAGSVVITGGSHTVRPLQRLVKIGSFDEINVILQ